MEDNDKKIDASEQAPKKVSRRDRFRASIVPPGRTLLQPDQYEKRAQVLQYTLTFSGAAVAFLVTAKEKLGFNLSPGQIKWLLGLWGLTILLGFAQYVLLTGRRGRTACILRNGTNGRSRSSMGFCGRLSHLNLSP